MPDITSKINVMTTQFFTDAAAAEWLDSSAYSFSAPPRFRPLRWLGVKIYPTGRHRLPSKP